MQALILIPAFALVAGAASMGAFFKPDAWYRDLEKPCWNPPNWIFAPVWTLLYIAMALAVWFAWLSGQGTVLVAGLVLWVLQLAANAAWSWLFFGRRRIGWALVDIGAMFLLILATLIVFFHLSLVAGLLLLPYLIWVGFAGCLNATLWRLNRRASV